jgi:hypothetical protein
MTKTRLDGFYLLLLGSAVFLLMGSALENAAPVTTVDFRLMYYSARCLLEHRDPYKESDLRQIYRTEGGESPQDTPTIRQTQTQYIYFPTAFSLTIPFALLSFGPAHILWLTFTAAGMILGAFLIWQVGANYAPVLSGSLIGLSLANCELFLAIAGPGGIAIGLCLVAVWCFVQERFVSIGIFCMAISLMLKPHDGGLVWLYFLLAGGLMRKRALQTLAALVALSLPSILWVSHVAPDWIRELHSNLVANAGHGGLSDPGPASKAGHGVIMIVSLQPIFAFFRDDPSFYNYASLLVSGGLLLVWLFLTLRSRSSPATAWFALAPISALSMLPVYHRLDDAKLLLLAIPACAMLWKKGGPIAWVAMLVNTTATWLTGAAIWAILFGLIEQQHLHATRWSAKILTIAQVFPVPLILLIVGVFYLWVYSRHILARDYDSPSVSGLI